MKIPEKAWAHLLFAVLAVAAVFYFGINLVLMHATYQMLAQF